MSKTNLFHFVLLFFACIANLSAQSITNGDFTAAGSGWGCSPETNPESTYGGPTSNRVAEVDAAAGLCQTISGLTIGSVYNISFDCSRRTTCGPDPQTMDFEIDGGALAAVGISRSGPFHYSPESFDFIATATSHTIDFNGTSVGTCGLIVDNITLTLVSELPIELTKFHIENEGIRQVKITWETASELNNDYFTIERSNDGVNWLSIADVDGAGNSSKRIAYSLEDTEPILGLSYYRLKQTDFDGSFTHHPSQSAWVGSTFSIFPNPTNDFIQITSDQQTPSVISVFNMLGQDVSKDVFIQTTGPSTSQLNFSNLMPGQYFIQIGTAVQKLIKK